MFVDDTVLLGQLHIIGKEKIEQLQLTQKNLNAIPFDLVPSARTDVSNSCPTQHYQLSLTPTLYQVHETSFHLCIESWLVSALLVHCCKHRLGWLS